MGMRQLVSLVRAKESGQGRATSAHCLGFEAFESGPPGVAAAGEEGEQTRAAMASDSLAVAGIAGQCARLKQGRRWASSLHEARRGQNRTKRNVKSQSGDKANLRAFWCLPSCSGTGGRAITQRLFALLLAGTVGCGPLSGALFLLLCQQKAGRLACVEGQTRNILGELR